MAFLIGLLTFVLLAVCAMLVLLVLMQLPKKDAGAGLAFGAGATDALFGAGSGNFLTKATKYAAIAFFVLAVGIGMLENRYARRTSSEFQKQLLEQQNQPLLPPPAATASAPAPTPAPAAAATGTNFSLTIPAGASNAAPASAPQK